MSGTVFTGHLVRLPLRRPLRSAHGVEVTRDLIVISCRLADGTVGWGECPTLTSAGYSSETTDRAWAALRGGGPLGPMAAGALADAELDATLRSEGVSLAEHLRARQSYVETTRVVDLDGEVPADRFVKLKVTPRSTDRLEWAADRLAPRRWAVDANGSFEQLEEAVSVFADLPLAYLEQPFAVGRDDVSASLAVRIDAPVALDESVSSPAELHRLHSLGAMSVVSVKPARLGGLEAAAQLIDDALGLGLAVFVGGMWESGVGRAGALALAAREGVILPSDLSPTGHYLAADICAPLRSDGARVLVPEGPGNGAAPDPQRLARHTIARAPLAVQ